jgi:hypothetical protein
VCLLRDSWASDEDPDFVHNPLGTWSYLFEDSTTREEVFEVGKIYRRADHRGIWILAGHRTSGLDVCLHKGLLDMNGSIVSLKRDKSEPRPYWELRIDNFDGPVYRRSLEEGM